MLLPKPEPWTSHFECIFMSKTLEQSVLVLHFVCKHLHGPWRAYLPSKMSAHTMITQLIRPQSCKEMCSAGGVWEDPAMQQNAGRSLHPSLLGVARYSLEVRGSRVPETRSKTRLGPSNCTSFVPPIEIDGLPAMTCLVRVSVC